MSQRTLSFVPRGVVQRGQAIQVGVRVVNERDRFFLDGQQRAVVPVQVQDCVVLLVAEQPFLFAVMHAPQRQHGLVCRSDALAVEGPVGGFLCVLG